MAWMGLALAIQHTVPQADPFHGTRQDGCTVRRAMALRGERGRDFAVALSFAGQAEDRRYHLGRACAIRKAADRDRQIRGCGRAAAPHHAYVNAVASTATETMDDHLV